MGWLGWGVVLDGVGYGALLWRYGMVCGVCIGSHATLLVRSASFYQVLLPACLDFFILIASILLATDAPKLT